jgi:hypothetical protein
MGRVKLYTIGTRGMQHESCQAENLTRSVSNPHGPCRRQTTPGVTPNTGRVLIQRGWIHMVRVKINTARIRAERCNEQTRPLRVRYPFLSYLAILLLHSTDPRNFSANSSTRPNHFPVCTISITSPSLCTNSIPRPPHPYLYLSPSSFHLSLLLPKFLRTKFVPSTSPSSPPLTLPASNPCFTRPVSLTPHGPRHKVTRPVSIPFSA